MNTATQPCCQQRRDLAQELSTAARLYSEAIVDMTTNTISRDVAFEGLRLQAEKARVSAEAARLLFENHIASHRC